ncbi:tryptophan transporter [Clostridium hydrogeniformans]|uniref:tryptophan transporter n=1 Tax=Clostridium hydrogeniformans TaxID=349933 RepID=UPI0004866367|nr:tryptophan transporter [Clostridium hydrogeniformans]
MNTKKLVLNSMLMAIGAVLHQITPPIFFGMKPDLSLIMLIILVIESRNYKEVLSLGILCGIISAMTTGFPGGQIPNFIDKIITASLLYFLRDKLRINKEIIKLSILSILGTLISGGVFLFLANIFVGLPVAFYKLFIGVVLPTSGINLFPCIFIKKIMERKGIKVSF